MAGSRRAQRRGLPRFGVLQAVIVAGVLMLSVRIGALYEDLNGWVATIHVGQSQALAVETGRSATPAPTPQVTAAPERVGPEAEPIGPATPGGMPPPPANGAPDMAAEAAAGVTPPGFTQSEINLLQRLAERREELDAVERELTNREALLQAAERRIETRIGELKELEGVIQGLLEQHSAQEQAQIDQLVSIYATMKPKDAARIFNDLEMPILLTVIENMKERSSAAILAEMTPTRAKEVTTELARRRALPGRDPMAPEQEAALP
ncbi:MotE family protein [Roseospira goensis]|uniref:Flagellar motility protein MotE (MotC chaperone) n=1 Tax=Roseospira goensis TaxID=391922 RepID=A0A7W6S2K8_9PROT|nr:hypothetical protein [Roseospira goensis]MBB4287034.1 flagellar motility protein MotE (MotC chaperone) [Roseospira goensis]